MGKIQNLDVSLQDLVAKIDRGEYHIPKFQRDFVWKKSDIESLGDSIIRSYPISSMLVMPKNGTLTIGAGPLKTNGSILSENNGDYVLDGQQRITSIARIFLGLDAKYEYYFDLLSMLVERFPEDDITNDTGIQSKIVSESNYNYSKIGENFCKAFSKSQNGDEKNTRQYNRFISGRAIIENRYGAVINKFLRSFEEKDEECIDKYTDYLNAMLGAVGGYGIPMTRISEDSDLGLVIRVFEKVNSTGKNLAIFDLINAKTFKSNDDANAEGLADFLYNEINKYRFNKPNTKCIENFFEYSVSQDQYKNLARVIRIVAILEIMQKSHHPHYTKTYLFNKDANFWFEMWEKHGNEILDTLVWLEESNLVSLGNKILLEFIVPILIIFPKLKRQNIFRDNLKKYILYSNIKNISFSKTNLDIVMKFYEFAKELDENANSLYKHGIRLPINMDLNLTENDVAGITVGQSRAYISSLYVLFKEKHIGVGNVDLTNSPIDYDSSIALDEHHIIPKSTVRYYPKNSLYNSIANITPLNLASNRWEIKDTPFYEYVDKLQSVYSKKEFEHILLQNIIDPDLVQARVPQEEILRSRARKIAAIITSYFNNAC